MKDISKQTMASLMAFMYKGEVDVKRDLLLDFMNTAKALKIKGLADDRFSFKPGKQQLAQSTRHGAIHGAVQYQSSQMNRNEGPTITHQNLPAAIHQKRSMNENCIGLPAIAMLNDSNINPYAMKNFNDGDRSYGFNNDYESDDDQSDDDGSNIDVPIAKRPKLEPNGKCCGLESFFKLTLFIN